MRVATYTRISTDEDHQPHSLDAQAHRLGSYIASQEGWELARTFSDQASGATTERPGLQRALAEARARRYDLLLVYRVDRFSRSVRGLAHLLEELDAAEVAVSNGSVAERKSTPASSSCSRSGRAADRAGEAIDAVDQEQVEAAGRGLGERAPKPRALEGGAGHLVREAADDPPALLRLGVGGEALGLRLERVGPVGLVGRDPGVGGDPHRSSLFCGDRRGHLDPAAMSSPPPARKSR